MSAVAGLGRGAVAAGKDQGRKGRPRVALFALGGTIASVSRPDATGADIGLTGEDLVAAVPSISGVAEVAVRSLRHVPSGDLGLADVLELKSEIERAIASGASGVVVTQGTDTLEEVAFALDLLIEDEAPVAVTGAMRNASLPGPDGPANVAAAVAVAANGEARGLGTVVVFNDEIHAARFVRKRYTMSPATFGSPLTGPLGTVAEGRVRVFLRPPGRLTIRLPEGAQRIKVALIPISFDDAGDLLTADVLNAYGGAVIAAFGGGHVPRTLVDRLEALSGRMPVVVATRTFGGEMLRSTYAYPGGEQDLIARGLIVAGAYDAIHARVLLQLLLMAGADRGTIARTFAEGLTHTGRLVVEVTR
jgi:L-asparaginase